MRSKLTASQLNLWLGQKLNPEVPLYNTFSTYEFEGQIDEILFAKAFQDLINSTDALRITFYEEDGVPYQEVKEKLTYEIALVDLSNAANDSEVSRFLTARCQQILDLSTTVFDSVLLRLGADRYLWYINIHHLVTDGVSRKIIFDRMASLYSRHIQEVSVELPLTPSFLEFVETEMERAFAKSGKNKYWTEKINELDKAPEMYGVKIKTRATESTRIELNLGKVRTSQLKALAQHTELRSWTSDLSLFNLLTGLLFIYLYRISGQENLAIGVPLHNRVQRKYRDTVGYFIEIYPLCLSLNAEKTFFSVMRDLKVESNQNLKHAIMEVVTPEISNSFNVVMNYIQTGFDEFCGLKTKADWIFPGHLDSNHDMRCHVTDFNNTGETVLLFDLNHNVFNSTLISQVPHHFLNLMDAMLDNVDSSIAAPFLLNSREIDRLQNRVQFADSTLQLNEAIHYSFSAFKHQIAIQAGTENVTYYGLSDRVRQRAIELDSLDIQKQEAVGLYLQRSPEYIITVLALLQIDAVFVPMASDIPLGRLHNIISDGGIRLIISESALINKITDLEVATFNVEAPEVAPVLHSNREILGQDLAYILFTSGSTGKPKGVPISIGALENYLGWAKSFYSDGLPLNFPLFTSIGFDLTITSTFLPLLTGGCIHIYRESLTAPDSSIINVLSDRHINAIKLTPSHLSLIQETGFLPDKLECMIVGGEDLKANLALDIQQRAGDRLKVYNEYGPTEATVGSIIARFDPQIHKEGVVSIGHPITNMNAFVLDTNSHLVPQGVVGELYLAGVGLANGYLKDSEKTAVKFVPHFSDTSRRMYRTGDLARWNFNGELECLGRVDEQVKIHGHRIELQDIEVNMASLPQIDQAAVVVLNESSRQSEAEIKNCTSCGLPSNYPQTDFDDQGVCHLCNAFRGYKEKAEQYFKSEEELKTVLTSVESGSGDYDCLTLLSGGKDSTYVLARLVNMGLKVLAFTMDNGYISDQAKANINTIVKKLGVDHVYGYTEHMNSIFVDSLQRHSNVCNGCFKTIYTLSTQIARERNIPFIVTGLSRGQFFETRLTEELFWKDERSMTEIDTTILEARKIYHQEEDAVKDKLDTSVFQDPETFEKVRYVDFYRYCNVSLEDMLHYLKTHVGWQRPTDTGRSTNCLINQLGIYVHKKKKGYSNYAFPYSWDVRLGHKTRDESLEEINEYIDEQAVKRMMQEIGYSEEGMEASKEKRLAGFYSGPEKVSSADLVRELKDKLPVYMIPTNFTHLESMPLTTNGKVDKKSLEGLYYSITEENSSVYVAPENEIQELLATMWQEVLLLDRVGIHDNFIALGGHSLAAIRVTARINKELELDIKLSKIFEYPSIEEYGKYVEETITSLLEN